MSLRRGHTVFLSWALNSPASFFISCQPRSRPPTPSCHFFLATFVPLAFCLPRFFSPPLFGQYGSRAAAAAYLSLPRSSFLSLAVFPLPPSFLTSLFAAWTAGGFGGCEGGGGWRCKVVGSARPHPRLFARLICRGSGLRRTAYCTQ